jgi:hypothetical protein
MVKVVSVIWELSTVIKPLWASMIRLLMAKPMPMPLALVVVKGETV